MPVWMKGTFQFSPGWSATRIGWPNWVISTCCGLVHREQRRRGDEDEAAEHDG